jgi:hypothetical protein
MSIPLEVDLISSMALESAFELSLLIATWQSEFNAVVINNPKPINTLQNVFMAMGILFNYNADD